MANLFDAPPALTGDERNQTEQLYRYMAQMSEALNEALNGLTMANFVAEAQDQIIAATAGGGQAAKKEIDSTKNALRSLIIKTAEIVRTEMEEISTELRTMYQGISSDFGTLERELTARIQANAEGISQNYTYIENVNTDQQRFENRISARIFSGIISYDAQDLPIYGIAIGENVTQYDQSGNPVLNENTKMATFTTDRLSFWQGQTEVAYFSQQKLFITNCEILRAMKMGRYEWRIQSDGSMGLSVL